MDKIKKARSKNKEVVRVVEKMKKSRSKDVVRGRMANRKRVGVEGKKIICTKK